MRKVLIVDDSSVARKILMRLLPKDWPVEIRQAGGGAEALAACQNGDPPEVMFLDLNMADVDGYEVLSRLRGGPAPITIVLSGDIQPIAQARVLEMGAKAFLKKPANAELIAKTLADCGVL